MSTFITNVTTSDELSAFGSEFKHVCTVYAKSRLVRLIYSVRDTLFQYHLIPDIDQWMKI